MFHMLMNLAANAPVISNPNLLQTLPHVDHGMLDHTNDLMRVVFPLLGAIAGLVVWAFRRLEKADDKVIDTFEKCTDDNDKIHDELFTLIREHERKIAELHEFQEKVKIHHNHQHGENL